MVTTNNTYEATSPFLDGQSDLRLPSRQGYQVNFNLWRNLPDDKKANLKTLVDGIRLGLVRPSNQGTSSDQDFARQYIGLIFDINEFKKWNISLDANAIIELSTPGKSMRGHIAGRISANHSNPSIATFYGVPQQDLQVMSLLREIYPVEYPKHGMNWMVNAIIERLEGDLRPGEVYIGWGKGTYDYETVLVKMLKSIEGLELAEVDWHRVEQVFPGANRVALDWNNDSIFADFNASYGEEILVAIGYDREVARKMIGGKDHRPATIAELKIEKNYSQDIYRTYFSETHLDKYLRDLLDWLIEAMNDKNNEIASDDLEVLKLIYEKALLSQAAKKR